MHIGSRLAKWPRSSKQRERPQVGKPPPRLEIEPPGHKQYYAQRRLLKLATKRRQSNLRPDRLPRKDSDQFYKDLVSNGLPFQATAPPRRHLFSSIPEEDATESNAEQDDQRQAAERKSPGFLRAVIPKIAACRTWRRLHKKIVPKYIFGFDSACTSYFYRNLRRLYPQQAENTKPSKATQAALASATLAVRDDRSSYHRADQRPQHEPANEYAQDLASFELMVRAVGVVVARKLYKLSTKALVSVPVGLGHTRIRDLRLLHAWELACGYKLDDMIGDQLVAITCGLGHLGYIPSLQFMAAFFTTLGRKLRTMNLFWLTMLCKGLSLLLQASTAKEAIPENEALVRLLKQKSIRQDRRTYAPDPLEVPANCVSQMLDQLQRKLSQLECPQTTHSFAPAAMLASLVKASPSASAAPFDGNACQSMGISETWLVWYLTYLQTHLESKRWHLKPLDVCILLDFTSAVHSILLSSTHATRAQLTQLVSSVTQLTCASACYTFPQHALDGETSKRIVSALLSMNYSPGASFISSLLKSTEKQISQMQASEGAWLVHGLHQWEALPSAAEPWMAAILIVTRSQLNVCSVNELVACVYALTESRVDLPQFWVNALLRDIHDRLQRGGAHAAEKKRSSGLDAATKARLTYLLQMVPSCKRLLRRSSLREGSSTRVGARLTALESEYLLGFMV